MLRPYQARLIEAVTARWGTGARNVVMQLATGGGKTVCIAAILKAHTGASAVIAHRAELVSQLSQALAREGVRHNLICAQADAAAIARSHAELFGRVYYDPAASCAVISVDTLARREDLELWESRVTLWIVDEGHHVLAKNKWGRALARFTHPDVRGLLPTATPSRADGRGLGRHADGVADVMVRGPDAGWLMEQGYLTRYRVVAADSHVTDYLGNVAAGGDWSTSQLRQAALQSRIVGDVATSYLQHAPGKLGITFASDVQTAKDMAASYVAAGVPAAVLTGDTPEAARREIWSRFRRRDLLQVVAVDVISEGVDIPVLEVVSFARATASLGVMLQQLGRLLRPDYASGYDLETSAGRMAAMRVSSKGERPLLIDHVGNFLRHGGGPEMPRAWTLDRRDKRAGTDTGRAGVRVCTACAGAYPRPLIACPFCGEPKPPPTVRSSPAYVEGDLAELDPAVLSALWQRCKKAVLTDAEERERLQMAGCPSIGIERNVRAHAATRDAQEALRAMMALAGGYWREAGHCDRTAQRLFWVRYGVDVLTAQSLGRDEAVALTARIAQDIQDCAL